MMPSPVATRRGSRRWLAGALAYNAVAALLLLLLPLTTTVDAGGGTERHSLLATDPGVAVPLAVPVLLSVLALLGRQRWLIWTAFSLLAAGVLVSIASVGLGFVPGLVLLGVGAVRSGRAPS